MATKGLLLLAMAGSIGGIVAMLFGRPQRPGGANDELARSLIEMERQWAEVDVNHDVTVLERILADDFVGTSTQGKLYTKADAIERAKASSSAMESNHLNEVKVRFFGEVAVLRGSETWARKANGKTETGTDVWTDTWLKRAGRWQIVAAQDMLLPAKN